MRVLPPLLGIGMALTRAVVHAQCDTTRTAVVRAAATRMSAERTDSSRTRCRGSADESGDEQTLRLFAGVVPVGLGTMPGVSAGIVLGAITTVAGGAAVEMLRHHRSSGVAWEETSRNVWLTQPRISVGLPGARRLFGDTPLATEPSLPASAVDEEPAPSGDVGPAPIETVPWSPRASPAPTQPGSPGSTPTTTPSANEDQPGSAPPIVAGVPYAPGGAFDPGPIPGVPSQSWDGTPSPNGPVLPPAGRADELTQTSTPEPAPLVLIVAGAASLVLALLKRRWPND